MPQEAGMDNKSSISPYLSALSQGVEEAWRAGDFTDVEVHVGDKTFNCHRIVLSSLSHYFQV